MFLQNTRLHFPRLHGIGLVAGMPAVFFWVRVGGWVGWLGLFSSEVAFVVPSIISNPFPNKIVLG